MGANYSIYYACGRTRQRETKDFLVNMTARDGLARNPKEKKRAEGRQMRFTSLIRNAAIVLGLVAVGGLGFAGTAAAQVSIGISVGFAPPELPVYEQPICPGDGYIWTPGYWAWDDEYQDYYWVPGTWVEAPQPGYLWTPAYWGWGGSAFIFHEGYWGPRVGFYGGIDYGYGYTGRGYEGGRWEGNRFYYNRTVNNVTNVRNVYNTTIVNNVNVTRVSYNGGNGGVNARASAQEEEAARERHVGRVAAQNQQVQEARSNRELRASENHGKPPIAATSRPGNFSGGGAVAARQGGNYNPPANRAGGNANRNDRPPSAGNNNRVENNRPENNAPRSDRPTYVHPKELPPVTRTDRPNTGNPKTDQKYQQQQEKMYQKQEQDHQKFQQNQEQDHQRVAQQQPRQQQDQARQQQAQGRQQQMEQKHQQQTQHLEQKHEQQQQKMQQRTQPRPQAPSRPQEQKHPNGKP
jgi:hypothetical protein